MDPLMRVGAMNVFEDNEGTIKLAVGIRTFFNGAPSSSICLTEDASTTQEGLG